MKKSFILITAVFSFLACTQTQVIDIQENCLTLIARSEFRADTRTVVEAGTHVYWEPGDEIAVFMGEKSAKFATELTASSGTAEFKGSFGTTDMTGNLWAVYPYSPEAVFDGETITTVLPSEQVAREGSFGKDMNLSIAHSSSSTLVFYNVGGGVRFTLSQDGITEVVFEGLNGETLAGKVKVGFQEGIPVIQEVLDGKSSIKITAPEGKAFKKDAWYYIVAIPGVLENGFTFHFRKSGDPNLVMPTSAYPKPVTIKRGVYSILTYVDKGMNHTVSGETILFQDPIVKSIVVKYFDTDKDGELSHHEAAVVLSFLVDQADTRADDGLVSIFAGTGIGSFDEMVYFTGLTRIDDGAFAGCSELTTITIPENVGSIGDNAFSGCTSLQAITMTSETPPVIGSNAFGDTGDCPIVVPADCLEQYSAEWGEYGDRIRASLYAVPEVVDLGLPSGLKWASFNLGATKAEIPGDFFAWGEIEPYYVSQDPLIWKTGKENGYSWPSYKWCKGTYYSITKYCTDPSRGYQGFTDGELFLSLEDDAAHMNLGGKWRMPTDAEWSELRENCTWIWSLVGGQYGYLVKGPNGNSLFLPFAGYRFSTRLEAPGAYGFYWSSSLLAEDPTLAWFAIYSCEVVSKEYCNRSDGLQIRPVYGDVAPAIHIESISLDKSEIEFRVGESATLRVDFCPSNATDTRLVWSSSDESVATVASAGLATGTWAVTGKSVGTAIITATSVDGGKTDVCSVTVKDASSSPVVPDAVDLGLSSGLKWASFNLGATMPEEYGDYFAWGETEPYYITQGQFTWKPGKEKGYYPHSYGLCRNASIEQLTKYCTDSSCGFNGFVDGKTQLDPEDDAAQISLGGGWRMPTVEDWRELRIECTWEWASVNDVNGVRVTGSNGNCIFLPAAGSRFGTGISHVDTIGFYWTATVYSEYPGNAWRIYFQSGYDESGYDSRYLGFSIRPVCE